MSKAIAFDLPAESPVMLPNDVTDMVCFTGGDPWMTFISRHYSYPATRITTGGADISGTLALMQVKHPLFGNYLVSAPFGSYGGFAFRTKEERDALLGHAKELADARNVEYALVRFSDVAEPPPAGWVQHPAYCTFILNIPDNLDTLMSSFSSNHRNHIRKSLKQGFSIRYGHLDLLDDAYEGISRGMHELGSPFHNKQYFKSMAESLKDTLSFVAMYDNRGKIAGGGVFITQGSTVTNLHGNILRSCRANHGGEFLYWSVIERYHSLGIRTFDMGRSLIGSGNEVFKMKWKPRRQQLAYWYYLRARDSVPELNQKNPKFQAAIWAWKHSPYPLVQIMGPHLIRGIA